MLHSEKKGQHRHRKVVVENALSLTKKVDIAWKSRYYWYVLPEPWCCSRPRIKARNGQSNNTKRSSCSLQARKGWTSTMGLKSLLVAFDFFLPTYNLTIYFLRFCVCEEEGNIQKCFIKSQGFKNATS